MICVVISTILMIAGEPPEIQIADAAVTLVDEVRISAQESGMIESLDIRTGDSVQSGQRLGKLNSVLSEHQLRLAKIRHAVAKTQAGTDIPRRSAEKTRDVASDAYQRALKSANSVAGSISKTELEKQRLTVEQAILEIEKADHNHAVAKLTEQEMEAEVERARIRLQLRQFSAPFAGVIVDVFRKPGEWVDPGDAILRLIRLDRLRVEGFVDGHLYGRELHGVRAVLTVHGSREPKRKYSGTVTFVSPELNPVSGRIRIWAEVENPDRTLRPGTRGTLTVQLKSAPTESVAK